MNRRYFIIAKKSDDAVDSEHLVDETVDNVHLTNNCKRKII